MTSRQNSDITGVEETKRFFDKILVIHTQDTEYKFFFTKREEWKIAFNNIHKPDFQKPEMQSTSTADELLKFKALLDSGAITEDEYNTQKNKLLR